MKSSFRIGSTRARIHGFDLLSVTSCGLKGENIRLIMEPDDGSKPVTVILTPDNIDHLVSRIMLHSRIHEPTADSKALEENRKQEGDQP